MLETPAKVYLTLLCHAIFARFHLTTETFARPYRSYHYMLFWLEASDENLKALLALEPSLGGAGVSVEVT